MLRELEGLAGLTTPRRRLAARLRRLASQIEGSPSPPRSGRLHLAIGHETLETRLDEWQSDRGDRFFLNLPEISEEAAMAAHSQYQRVCHLMDAPTRGTP
jgi:hypothetical protein